MTIKTTRGTVIVDLKVGESISLDLNQDEELRLRPDHGIGEVRFILRAKTGQRTRVVVQADESVKVRRSDAPA